MTQQEVAAAGRIQEALTATREAAEAAWTRAGGRGGGGGHDHDRRARQQQQGSSCSDSGASGGDDLDEVCTWAGLATDWVEADDLARAMAESLEGAPAGPGDPERAAAAAGASCLVRGALDAPGVPGTGIGGPACLLGAALPAPTRGAAVRVLALESRALKWYGRCPGTRPYLAAAGGVLGAALAGLLVSRRGGDPLPAPACSPSAPCDGACVVAAFPGAADPASPVCAGLAAALAAANDALAADLAVMPAKGAAGGAPPAILAAGGVAGVGAEEVIVVE
jgi:hypothetical protein